MDECKVVGFSQSVKVAVYVYVFCVKCMFSYLQLFQSECTWRCVLRAVLCPPSGLWEVECRPFCIQCCHLIFSHGCSLCTIGCH